MAEPETTAATPIIDIRPGATPLAEAAGRVMDTVADGGVAVIPLDVAYGIVGHAPGAVERIFKAKRRSYDKPSGFFSNWTIFNEIHITDQRSKDVVRAIILDHDLPFSVVAPYRADHPLMRSLEPFALEHSTKADTLDMLLNAGAFHNALTALAAERGCAVVGSSANTSLGGSKFTLGDVDAPVIAAADLAVDGGLSKYHNPEGISSTIVDLRSFKTVRRGVCYDRICAILLKDFGIDLIANGMA